MNAKTKVIAIVLVVLAFIAVSTYFGFKRFYFTKAPAEISVKSEEEIKPPVESSAKPESKKLEESSGYSAKGGPASGWKLFKNTEFGFEIQYPTSWTVTEKLEENVRGEMVKGFFFIKPGSDLRFAVLPRDGLSYGVGAKGTTTPVFIGGIAGMQTQYILKDGRRLWLIFPRYGLNNWLEDLGRLDIMTSIENVENDTRVFEQMLNSFKLMK